MNWMRFRPIYFIVSALVIAIGLFSLIKWGLPLGIDFKGGSLVEYRIQKDVSTEKLTSLLEEKNIQVQSIQKTSQGNLLLRAGTLDLNQKNTVKAVVEKEVGGEADELRFENVGPTVGPELVRKTVYAIAIASVLILCWVAFQFKSLKFGVSAILAMFHDSLVLIGLYSLFGRLFGAEVDFLFVTALLTILSFSVHDTIVVYDRIREMQKKQGGTLEELANIALTQTMTRSLNNSLTIVFMLVALVLLGGTTVKWFAVALLVGTISGTYSSPFVAVPLLVTWDELEKRFKKS